tara:strand:- start:3547 stop:4155 length:609 start_codon:yes stop_codon:yes gene_type:complete
MINFIQIEKSDPYNEFHSLYIKADRADQKNIEAVCISSFNKKNNEVNSRYVNLKYIKNNKWVFFSNYNSPKAIEFISNNQISALFFWNEISTQIRIKGLIYKIDKKESEKHFLNRSFDKNILAISSMQSREIDSYKKVVDNYNKIYKASKDNKNSINMPDYWGGYCFIPNYFEFWTGDPKRINKRTAYKLNDNSWIPSILEP